MIYEIFLADVILIGITVLVYLIGGIKLYGSIALWLRKELSGAPAIAIKAGARIENTRIRRILKNEYSIAKQQDDLKIMKIVIKINKQIKQEEE